VSLKSGGSDHQDQRLGRFLARCDNPLRGRCSCCMVVVLWAMGLSACRKVRRHPAIKVWLLGRPSSLSKSAG
jgi:hypothetical protein